jgi:hypothetical protein
MRPTAWDFRNKLTVILNMARQKGDPYVDVESGHLHNQVGGYPNSNHGLPICCDVMKRMMRAGDSIVAEAPTGHGSTLTIRYFLKGLESQTSTKKLQ